MHLSGVAPVSWTPDPKVGEGGVTVPRLHRPYAAEFRRRMVDLVRAGRTPESLGEEVEPTAQAIRNWVCQAERDEGHRPDDRRA